MHNFLCMDLLSFSTSSLSSLLPLATLVVTQLAVLSSVFNQSKWEVISLSALVLLMRHLELLSPLCLQSSSVVAAAGEKTSFLFVRLVRMGPQEAPMPDSQAALHAACMQLTE